MIFNSLTYLLLLLIIIPLYWLMPYRARLILVLGASLTFYGFWSIKFLSVLLISIIVDYVISLMMLKCNKKYRFFLLCISLITNLGLLFYFKYFIFFTDNLLQLTNILGLDLNPITLKVILPIGISFYTFQTISYTVDVYKGFIKPEKNFILFACYVMFFPQLVAGPILRAKEVIPQFINRSSFLFDYILVGIRFILFGLFLKVVLADNLSTVVDSGFLIDKKYISAVDVWTLAFLFGFQIYFDFSGYSFIALGSARMMGIFFPNNFNFPYISSSPKDFWQRWHISLSSWVRDYIYLPLNKAKIFDRSSGGFLESAKIVGTNKSLIITMGIMGLWHGANWTFLVWGIYHAIFIIIYRLVEPKTRNLPIRFRFILGILVTLPVIMLSWIPFRANSLTDTLDMWLKIFNPLEYTWLGMRENIYIISFLVLISFFIVYLFKIKILPIISSTKYIFVICDIIFITFITSMIVIFFGSANPFIYFQF